MMVRQLCVIPIGLLLAYGLVFSTCIGQVLPLDSTKRQAISDQGVHRYESYIQSEIKEGNIPGAVTMIAKDNRVIHYNAYGLKNFATEQPLEKDHIFRLMSMTKPVVSVALMMLFEEGHFLLSDPITKYLPFIKVNEVVAGQNYESNYSTEPIASEITIAQLLSHTAGFSHGLRRHDYDKGLRQALYKTPHPNLKSRVISALEYPLVIQPGQSWNYSISPDIIVLLIEELSGKSIEQFLDERIFTPLNMYSTYYQVPTQDTSRVVPIHHKDTSGELVVASDQKTFFEVNTLAGGTHGLYSTAADYMNFCSMLLNHGQWNDDQLLSKKTIELMTADHVGGTFTSRGLGYGFGYGFGIVVDASQTQHLGSDGQYFWGGAYCTYFFVDPKEQLIGIFMTQVDPYNLRRSNTVKNLMYQSVRYSEGRETK